jgi:hypothetical protein
VTGPAQNLPHPGKPTPINVPAREGRPAIPAAPCRTLPSPGDTHQPCKSWPSRCASDRGSDTANTPLPGGVTSVAVTSDMTSFDATFRQSHRHSHVSAVVHNMWVAAQYGPAQPREVSADMDLDAVPVQAERAAAVLVVRQVITEISGSS